uniref:Antitoxin component of toxin-antitoxin stability system, DNA-binding transcriptional repressor n=1 Tax=Candidatus Kentrum sp. FM TaxID=2126340 RepID=A0A450TJS1_9GAMM|nr:MAG: hypothetical protein BECKFM1743A_GA0114220_104544 [Candidatus Kentron sp. FM]
MKTLRINEPVSTLPSSLSSALAKLEEKQESFVILRDGKSLADLVPHRWKDRRSPHPIMSAIEIHYDPTEALTEDEWSEGDEA